MTASSSDSRPRSVVPWTCSSPALDQRAQFLPRHPRRHEIRDRNGRALLGMDPAAERGAHASHEVLLLGREALVDGLVEHGADRLERQELPLLQLTDVSQALEVLVGVERGIAAGLDRLRQQSLQLVEMDRLARQAAFAHQVAHAQQPVGGRRRCARRPALCSLGWNWAGRGGAAGGAAARGGA